MTKKKKYIYCCILCCLALILCLGVFWGNKIEASKKVRNLNEFFFYASEQELVDEITEFPKMCRSFLDYEVSVDSYIYDKDNNNAYIKMKISYMGDKYEGFNMKTHFLENSEDITISVQNGGFWQNLYIECQDCEFETDSYYVFYHIKGFEGELMVSSYGGNEWEISLEDTCEKTKEFSIDEEKSILVTPITIAIEIDNLDFIMTDEMQKEGIDVTTDDGIDNVKLGYKNGEIQDVVGKDCTYSKRTYDTKNENDIVRIIGNIVIDVENIEFVEINGIKYK